MRNIDQWKPTRVVKDPSTGRFITNRQRVYGGSLYIGDRQHEQYLPLFSEHLKGSLLDVGCGPVPYYEFYKDLVSENICVDYEGCVHGKEHIDEFVDLNETRQLPFPAERFDTVLAADMIVHMKRPHEFMKEMERVLKPGGKLVLTAPFVYWMGEYPYEFFHISGPGLRYLAEDSGLEVVHLKSYGGHMDVWMDALNKAMPSGLGNRLFILFSKFVLWTGWPARNRERSRDRYAQGYSMVMRKPG